MARRSPVRMTTKRPRVYELARELDVTSREVLDRLAEITAEAPRSASAAIDEELAQALRARLLLHRTRERREAHPQAPPTTTPHSRERAAALIRAAFAAARNAGRTEEYMALS